MEKATRKNLAKVAEKAAQIPFHGYIEGKESNLEPVIRFFPTMNAKGSRRVMVRGICILLLPGSGI